MSDHLQSEEHAKHSRAFQPTAQGDSTRAVHAHEARVKSHHALVDPIFQTSTYTFENMADVCAFQESHAHSHVADRFEYGRYGNPTSAAAEARLAALEHAEGAILVASGMAALTDTFLNLLSPGKHIIMTDDSYRRTRQFCEEFLTRYDVAVTVVPLGDYDALEAAIRPETRVLFSETPSNPYLRVLDVERFAEIGRRRGVLTVIDATFATPINLRPLDWGIDLITHSATKYLGGHNDLLAGFIAGRNELIDPLRDAIGILGGISDSNTAYLLLRGMKTLSVRVQKQNQTAQQIAEFLAAHPNIEHVWYPGLKTHPGHAIAARQMNGFGGVVSFTVRGDLDATFRFMDALRIPYISPSLGGVESLALHVAKMAYYDVAPAERLKLGIPDNLVRFAVGIEDAQDLIADLDQALRFSRLVVE
ncbi:MAG: aminotransferase class I/II-fold pyridoxal phosphate-dependent enzyme [Chloroflexi bacterium]|nr:aminotransferase class I/II-fold pyridoxal phosphate-dependent enzyme [Chloroflexota bacterium]